MLHVIWLDVICDQIGSRKGDRKVVSGGKALRDFRKGNQRRVLAPVVRPTKTGGRTPNPLEAATLRNVIRSDRLRFCLFPEGDK
jgi:hypothetical protein